MGSIPQESTEDGLGQLFSELPSHHLEPLWLKMDAMVPTSPNPVAKPYLWKYQDALPNLLRAGKLVPAESAERRVLMLVNPSMTAPYTTDTIYGGLQLVNPGEVAPAHRHIAFAARFIIDGSGFTAVEGKRMALERGDVILTPTWHWHDHGNESDAPVIWLDALNLPLFRYARVNFAELYSESRYPSEPANPPQWRYPWAPVQAALDGANLPHATHHYQTPDGKPLSTTIGMQAERLGAGVTTESSRHPSSFLYHCHGGSGRTIIDPPNGERVVVEWTCRDTFAVPAWSRVQHVNASGDEPAYLVAVNDRPFLELLGLTKPGV